MKSLKLPLFLACAISLTTSLCAQQKTRSGYTMDWDRTLQERADPLVVGRIPLNGWSFMVYECGTSQALSHWKTYMGTLGGSAKSNKPVRVTGATIPGLSSAVPIVFADARKDRDAKGVRIHVVFAQNDSAAVPEDPGMMSAVHEMAVKVNRAVVQEQVSEQEKRVREVGGELGKAQKEEAKITDRTASAAKDLEKADQRQAKLARQLADIQKETIKLQEKNSADPDPRTLLRIAKQQHKEAKVNENIARQLQAGAKAGKHKHEHEQQIPDAQQHQQEHADEKDIAIRELEALKRKMEAIR